MELSRVVTIWMKYVLLPGVLLLCFWHSYSSYGKMLKP